LSVSVIVKSIRSFGRYARNHMGKGLLSLEGLQSRNRKIPVPGAAQIASAEGRASNSRRRDHRPGDDYENLMMHGMGHSSTSPMNKDVPQIHPRFVLPGPSALS
jgi:hypothetical protein